VDEGGKVSPLRDYMLLLVSLYVFDIYICYYIYTLSNLYIYIYIIFNHGVLVTEDPVGPQRGGKVGGYGVELSSTLKYRIYS